MKRNKSLSTSTLLTNPPYSTKTTLKDIYRNYDFVGAQDFLNALARERRYVGKDGRLDPFELNIHNQVKLANSPLPQFNERRKNVQGSSTEELDINTNNILIEEDEISGYKKKDMATPATRVKKLALQRRNMSSLGRLPAYISKKSVVGMSPAIDQKWIHQKNSLEENLATVLPTFPKIQKKRHSKSMVSPKRNRAPSKEINLEYNLQQLKKSRIASINSNPRYARKVAQLNSMLSSDQNVAL